MSRARASTHAEAHHGDLNVGAVAAAQTRVGGEEKRLWRLFLVLERLGRQGRGRDDRLIERAGPRG